MRANVLVPTVTASALLALAYVASGRDVSLFSRSSPTALQAAGGATSLAAVPPSEYLVELGGAVPASWSGKGTDVTDDDDDELVEVKVNLREFDTVITYLESKGLTNESSDEEFISFIPKEIKVRMWPSRIKRSIGDDAANGSVRSRFSPCSLLLFSRSSQ